MKPSTAQKLLKLNYDLYEHQAQCFSKTRSRGVWEEEIIDFVKKIPAGSSVLDLGCGNGRLLSQIVYHRLTQDKIKNTSIEPCSHVLKNLRTKYLGIDISKEFIKLNQNKFEKILFKIDNGLTIKFVNKFDYVISVAVLHHIPSEELQLKFLKNIHQALRPKGKALISVWNRWQTKYEKYFIFGNSKPKTLNPKQAQSPKIQNSKQFSNVAMKQCNNVLKSINFHDLDKTDMIVPWKQSGYFRYIHAFKPAELKSLARKAGFKNIQCFASRHGIKTTLSKALNIYLIGEK